VVVGGVAVERCCGLFRLGGCGVVVVCLSLVIQINASEFDELRQ
jgi:hypothetical protein